jgi:hypothetical protein
MSDVSERDWEPYALYYKNIKLVISGLGLEAGV